MQSTWLGGRPMRCWAHGTLSNLFVWGPVRVMLVAIDRHDGRYGPVADIQDAGRWVPSSTAR